MPLDKRVWYNDIQRDAFIEKNCDHCFQPDQAKQRLVPTEPGCPHLIRAQDNKMPKAWTVRRNASWGDTYRCEDFADKPASTQRRSAAADTDSMFGDLEEQDYTLVPVEGWPDRPVTKSKEGDHQ